MSKKILIFPILFLSSCIVGPDYEKPKIETHSSWEGMKNFSDKDQAPQISENIDQKWWNNFNDPVLDEIVNMVALENLDLKVAEAKLTEARANLRKETSVLAPKITAQSSVNRSSKIYNPLNPNKHKPVTLYDAEFDASWEIDLFGGVYRSRQSYLALLEASNEDKNSIKISVIGEAARNYMQLRNLQSQIEIHYKTIEALEEIKKLSIDKNQVGLMDNIDLEKVETQLLNEKSAIPGIENDLNSAILRVEVLCGKQPGELRELLKPKPSSIPQMNKEVIISAPAAVMRNRPDVKEAERNLASATALEGVAIAQRYPSISLTGLFGFQNTQSGNLFRSASKVFSLSPSVNLPIFDFGGIKADIKASKARKEQALYNYKSSILSAMEDIENALVGYAGSEEKLDISAKSFESSQLTVHLITEKYKHGLASFIDLLNAKLDLYQAHNTLIQSQTDLNTNLITLYKALGGGWEFDPVNNKENKKN